MGVFPFFRLAIAVRVDGGAEERALGIGGHLEVLFRRRRLSHCTEFRQGRNRQLR